MIRVADAGDIPVLHDLIERAFRGHTARGGWTHEADLLDGQRIDREGLGEILADPDRHILIAEDAGVLIGCVQVSRYGDGAALGLLAVRPDRQAGGLGRRLVAAAEAQARAAFAATVMEMTVIAQRAELIAWYERQGYVRTRETRPFPLDDMRFGLPRTRELYFVVLERALGE